MLEITIVVDTNDGDYVTEVSQINEQDLETLRPLFEAIKSNKNRHNFDLLDYGCIEDLAEEEYSSIDSDIVEDFLWSYCPETEFHTIKSIEFCPLIEKVKIL